MLRYWGGGRGRRFRRCMLGGMQNRGAPRTGNGKLPLPGVATWGKSRKSNQYSYSRTQSCQAPGVSTRLRRKGRVIVNNRVNVLGTL